MRRKLAIIVASFVAALSIPAAALAVYDGSGGTRPDCNAYTYHYTWTGADGRTWVCSQVNYWWGYDYEWR